MPRLRFSLAELLAATFLAGAIVGIYIFRHQTQAPFDPGISGRVVRAAYQAPDTLFVLAHAHKPFGQSNRDDRDNLYKLGLKSRTTTLISTKPVKLTTEINYGGYLTFALSPDGKRLCLPDHQYSSVEVRDSGDGRVLANVVLDHKYNIFPIGELVATLPNPDTAALAGVYPIIDKRFPGLIAFYPDASRAICCFDIGIQVRRYPSGDTCFELRSKGLSFNDVSPDGQLLLVNTRTVKGDWTVQAYDGQTGRKLDFEAGGVPFPPAFDTESQHVALVETNSDTYTVTLAVPTLPPSDVKWFAQVWNRRDNSIQRVPIPRNTRFLAFPDRGKLLTLNANGKIELRRFATTTPEIILYAVAAAALLALIILRLRSRIVDRRLSIRS